MAAQKRSTKTKRKNPILERRKRHFRAACAYFGLTRESWARQHGVATSYLDLVHHGGQSSRRVEGLIDQTILEFHQAAAAEYARLVAA